MILVDTSVWIDHLRQADPRLGALLESADVVTHPMVVGELAMGDIRPRSELLDLLDQLPHCSIATHTEVMALIEAQRLHGKGLGIVDAHLLASAVLTPGTALWTRDKQLAKAAATLGVD